MAESSMQERTEAPTPKRRQEAREEGRIPKSQELTTAALLLGSAIVLTMAGPSVASSLLRRMGTGITAAGAAPVDAASAVALVRETGWATLKTLAPLLTAMAGVALAITAVQARGVVTLKPLGPNWAQLDPIANAKRMLGARSFVELLKSLVKLVIVGVVVYLALSSAWPDLMSLPQQPASGFLEVVRRYSLRLLVTAGLSYLALAAADYFYQLWQHEKGLRMTKEEVKQEAKQSEIDPLIRARMRSVGRALARRQMFKDVPKADVVIANPTHIAVALTYDPEVAPAPVVLAIGQRKVAERIKAIARDAGVPIVENRPLARALLASARVGTMIPVELYVAVAEILAFVYRLRAARGETWKGSALA